jgi:hypothetical protein
MSEKQAKLITIDNKEYDTATFTDEQVLLTNHCLDLDRKIGSTQFQLDQLRVGKDSFLKMLKESLEVTDVEPNQTDG